MSDNEKERLSDHPLVVAIAAIGGVLAAFVACLAIFTFITGKENLPEIFPTLTQFSESDTSIAKTPQPSEENSSSSALPTTNNAEVLEKTSSPQNTLEINQATSTPPASDNLPDIKQFDLVSVIYHTEFDDTVEYIKNWSEYGSVDISDGNLIVHGKSSGSEHARKTLRVGDAILALFKYDSGASTFIYLTGTSGYIGISATSSSGMMMGIGDHDGVWLGGQSLSGNLSPKEDTWYYTYIEIRKDGEFYIKVWEPNQPDWYIEKTMQMGTEWANKPWKGRITTNQYNTGRIFVDSYWELKVEPEK